VVACGLRRKVQLWTRASCGHSACPLQRPKSFHLRNACTSGTMNAQLQNKQTLLTAASLWPQRCHSLYFGFSIFASVLSTTQSGKEFLGPTYGQSLPLTSCVIFPLYYSEPQFPHP
jgi:hypothetical protein